MLAQAAAFLAEAPRVNNITCDNLLHHPAWQQNQMCLDYLLTERQRAEKWLKYKPAFAFLFPSAIALLKKYRQSLQQSAHQWMIKQLALLKHVMATKENQPLDEAEKAILVKALDQLQAHTKSNGIFQGMC